MNDDQKFLAKTIALMVGGVGLIWAIIRIIRFIVGIITGRRPGLGGFGNWDPSTTLYFSYGGTTSAQRWQIRYKSNAATCPGNAGDTSGWHVTNNNSTPGDLEHPPTTISLIPYFNKPSSTTCPATGDYHLYFPTGWSPQAGGFHYYEGDFTVS
jgi:hypothetical protein